MSVPPVPTPPPAIAALRALAARLPAALAPADRLAGPATWIGPAADDTRAGLAAAERWAAQAAAVLRARADALEQAWRAAVAAMEAEEP